MAISRATDTLDRMQQALTSTMFRSMAVGGLLLALSLASGRAAPDRAAGWKPRLVLHTVWEADSVYLSFWHDGDFRMELAPGELSSWELTTTGWLSDGCQWRGIERLEPIGPRTYAYRYDETILRCRAGKMPYEKTPRVGTVTVED
jgi:hypothetical protein